MSASDSNFPSGWDERVHEENTDRYFNLKTQGKFRGHEGSYGLFLSNGQNLLFELESSALLYKKKLGDANAYVTMLHGEEAETIGPL